MACIFCLLLHCPTTLLSKGRYYICLYNYGELRLVYRIGLAGVLVRAGAYVVIYRLYCLDLTFNLDLSCLVGHSLCLLSWHRVYVLQSLGID